MRIIRSVYPPIDLYEDIADPADWPLLISAERRGQLIQTDLDDDDCEVSEAKIGPDNDESPGGGDNVVVTVSPAGQIATAYLNEGH